MEKMTINEVVFEPVETKRAYTLVYEDLRSRILGGEFPVEGKLPSERELAHEYGRSHPTIREALRMLERDGLVLVSQGGLAGVREPSLDMLSVPFERVVLMEKIGSSEIFEYQLACFRSFIEWSAKRRSEKDITDLKRMLKDAKSSTDNIVGYIEFLYRIHNHLFTCAENCFAAIVADLTSLSLSSDFKRVFFNLEEEERLFQGGILEDYYGKIIEALEKKETQLAKDCVIKLILHYRNLLARGENIPGRYDNESAIKDNISSDYQKASHAIFDQISRKIIDGELKVGMRLPSERKLIEMFDRSRPTIREALRMLESEGYITTTPGRKGAIVNKTSTAAVERQLDALLHQGVIRDTELLEFRRVHDPLNTGWAAERCTKEDLALLESIIEKSRVHSGNIVEFSKYDVEFHKILAKSARNRMAYLVTKVLVNVTRERRLSVFERMPTSEQEFYFQNAVEHHMTMLDFLRRQDITEARKIALEHVGYFASMLGM